MPSLDRSYHIFLLVVHAYLYNRYAGIEKEKGGEVKNENFGRDS